MMNDTDGCWSFFDADQVPFCSKLGAAPFYYSNRLSLLPAVSDAALALASPILAYWSSSLFFHFLDISNWQWLKKYRIHDSEEVKSRNRATRSEVVWAVLLQQLIQTVLGYFWMDGSHQSLRGPHEEMQSLAQSLSITARRIFGEGFGGLLVRSQGPAILHFLYWWAIPALQILFAMFFIDTWQYFLHRFMHSNKSLYKHFHSVHHRLYVPYAFGALYNHPFEGFLLDSLGTAFAEALSGMTIRQAILLFVVSTFKTVDDHCGYRLPFDPLQLVTSNNADYHDIHHQIIGIKSNFSQPFFVHWDVLLGTRMTRKEMENRHKASREKAR